LGTVAGTLQTHASDIADFIESNLGSSPPVLVGHSFGGLIVQYYLANIVNKRSLGKV
jgi:pimeloyl-ACP methyl ester carboxylesterase